MDLSYPQWNLSYPHWNLQKTTLVDSAIVFVRCTTQDGRSDVTSWLVPPPPG